MWPLMFRLFGVSWVVPRMVVELLAHATLEGTLDRRIDIVVVKFGRQIPLFMVWCLEEKGMFTLLRALSYH
jgi:hypothetical protein